MPCPSTSDNAAIVASALTSLIGLPVITQSDYLRQRSIGNNNVTYQNINPVSLHNSYLAGGAVSTISQQNNNGNVNQQQYIYFSNSQVLSHPFPNNLPSLHPQQNSQKILQPQQVQPQIHQQIQQIQPQIPQQIQPQISQQIQPKIPQQIQSQITINISTLNGQIISINNVPIISKISAIKSHIESKTRIPTNQQRLIYSGIHLKDNSSLLDYKIVNNNSTIYLIGQILGLKKNNNVISFVDSNFLDPMYDCDFTNVKDDKQFMRGSHEYRRPCGWKRIAVKVLNKYGSDNTWLGTAAKKGSWRYDSDPMEWPVSYHGTDKFNARSIAETGFDITKGKRFKFGHGIYSTPDINIAALYAKRFVHNNEIYCLVFQNRVNPNSLVKINTDIGEYWISPKSDDIRPYGICIKKL